MNNNDNTYIEYLKNFGTNLPRTEEEIKKQKLYDIVMSILILVPLFLGPILITFNHVLLGILIIVISYTLVAIIGINKRKAINRRFYKIKNAHNRFKIINVNDKKIIKELYNNSALTFMAEPSDELLDFIFNWLNIENVLMSEEINLYVFDGKKLKDTFEFSKVPEDIKFMSIFNKDLNINKSNIESYSRNHFKVGARWLDDIVGNDKTKLSFNADYMIYFNNDIKYDNLENYFSNYNFDVSISTSEKGNITIKSNTDNEFITTEFCIKEKEYEQYLADFEKDCMEDDPNNNDNWKYDLEKMKKFNSYYFIKTNTEIELKYTMILALYILEENNAVLVFDTYNGKYYDNENLKDILLENNLIEEVEESEE